MLRGNKIVVVLPAYNAENTLGKTVAEIDRTVVDEIILVDDASSDETLALANSLGLKTFVHERNLGYGGNQKTCFEQALNVDADIVVLLHPDYQYSPSLTVAMASMIAYDEYDVVLGSRILAQNSIQRGMPRYKYFSNRALTLFQNLLMRQKLSEYHTGLRAYRADLLRAIPFRRNSDDFVFDNQILAQASIVQARIGEVSCPTKYAEDSSSINFSRSLKYGVGVLRTTFEYRSHRAGLRSFPYLEIDVR
jgi:glycosyltransferase involved in cell wall biosynthesis